MTRNPLPPTAFSSVLDAPHWRCRINGNSGLSGYILCDRQTDAVRGTKADRRRIRIYYISLPFQNGGRFFGIFASTVKRLHRFSCQFDSLAIFIKPYNF